MSEAVNLLRLLLDDFHGERRYWDKRDCLNSDGRRLLHAATKALLDEEPGLRRLVYRVRRSPCIDNVRRLYTTMIEYGLS
ncbi:hypothetical protein Pyrfu_0668 [Pyrolobus fumarii 1A]|uniref:Uncharacterized protein n=1 Tax=Pyrolobus fumarii (strain DSM 11204 / 1A) TaxID=694429 RepID=G0EHG2_PYRF1|nr:hypothetical protein [Pyrolobus fumarii]AEM38537.1 hypothetical protein Pyrfu_0668 [Pyrolobus fumarii 1A]